MKITPELRDKITTKLISGVVRRHDWGEIAENVFDLIEPAVREDAALRLERAAEDQLEDIAHQPKMLVAAEIVRGNRRS